MSEYVNYLGQPVTLRVAAPQVEKRPAPERKPSHKGWQVRGWTQEAIEESRRRAERNGKELDEDFLIRTAYPPAISKAYATRSAAQHFADLAESAGIKKVFICELKREA